MLTRSVGGWTPAPDSRAYQWRRCNAAGGTCADIAGETGTTLHARRRRPRPDDPRRRDRHQDRLQQRHLDVDADGGRRARRPHQHEPGLDHRHGQGRRGAHPLRRRLDAGPRLARLPVAPLRLGRRQLRRHRRRDRHHLHPRRRRPRPDHPRRRDRLQDRLQQRHLDLGADGRRRPRRPHQHDPGLDHRHRQGRRGADPCARRPGRPRPTPQTYQWRRCDSGGGSCADIGGATGTTYTLVAADLGQTIRVVETASKTAYNNATSTSAQTAVVAAGDLTNTSPVSITGTVKVGEVLTRSAAGWNPGPDSRAYQWRRCNAAGGCCADIAGETGTSYTLVAADLGQTIRVVETASKTAYNNATSTSSQTAVVAAGDLTNTSRSRSPARSRSAKSSPAPWGAGPRPPTPAPTSGDAATRPAANCADISGETGTSYTLVAADLGQTIRVVETASKTAYNNASSTSAQTSVVAAGDFTNTSPVGITGTVKVGEVLTRSAGGWTPAPDSRAYQWRRCDSGGGSCADISGETGTSYTLVAADLGQTIRVVETASKTAYNNATSTSTQTAVVAAGDLTNTSPVSITGTVKVGEVLTRSAGGWTPAPDSRAYQWRRCDSGGGSCADISGETGTSYTLVAPTSARPSASSRPPRRPRTTTPPQRLRPDDRRRGRRPHQHEPRLDHRHRQGRRGPHPLRRRLDARPRLARLPVAPLRRAGGSCADIAGETGTSYTLVAADLGQTIRVVETASKTAYNNATSTSTQTAVVALGDLTNTTPVSITGTAKVGESLSRSSASWSPGPDSRAYQWRRCDNAGANCADIAGATGTDYTLVAADLGQTIRVVETASKTAYNDATSTSAQTAVVALGDFTNTTPVSITGTAKVGELLTRSAASWTPGPDARTYQWRRCDNAGANCADIGGETGNTYVLVAADLGQTIRVVETATQDRLQQRHLDLRPDRSRRPRRLHQHEPRLDHRHRQGRRDARPLGRELDARARLAHLPVAPLRQRRRELRRPLRRDRHELHARPGRPRPDDPRRRDRQQDRLQRRHLHLRPDRRRRSRRPHQHEPGLDHRHADRRRLADPVGRGLEPRPRLARLPVAPLRRGRRQLCGHRRCDRYLVRARRRRLRPDDPRRRDRLQDRLQRRHLHLRPDRGRRPRHDHEHRRPDRLGHAHGDAHPDRYGRELDARRDELRVPVGAMRRRRDGLRRPLRRDRLDVRPRRGRRRQEAEGARDGVEDGLHGRLGRLRAHRRDRRRGPDAADEHDHARLRRRRVPRGHDALLPPSRGRFLHALERRRRRRLGPGLRELPERGPGGLDAWLRVRDDAGGRPLRLERVLLDGRCGRDVPVRRHGG